MKKPPLIHLPKTCWGFPVEAGEDPPKGGPQRGIALIIAVMAVSLMMIFTSDLIVSSEVNLELATAHRDNVKAEYMAKSAFNLGVFLLSLDWGIDLFLAGPQSPAPTKPSDGPGDIWAMLNGMPIGGGTAELLASAQSEFNIKGVNDSNVVDQLKLFDGEFTMNIEDESSRIDVNYCAIGRCSEVISMLTALTECPAEKQYLERKNVRPKEIIYKIKDWIDSDRRAEPESGVNDEDDPYQKKVPPYRAKSAPMDSISELKMVDGWDQDMDVIFGPYMTVFPFQKTGNDKPKININTASRELMSCLIPSSTKECNEKFQASLREAHEDKGNLVQDAGGIAAYLKDKMCYNQSANGGDPDNRATWFTTTSNVYRLTMQGEVGNQKKELFAIIERSMPDPTRKELASYKILFWKML